jgi:hypothetical protein
MTVLITILSVITISLIIMFIIQYNGVSNSGSLYSSELQAVIDKAESLSITLPSESVLLEMDTLMQGLVSNGIYSDLDIFYCFLHDGAKNFCKINWIDPDSYYLGEVNTVNFSSLNGVKSSGTSFFSTGYYPSMGGVNYTLNDAMFGFSLESASLSGMSGAPMGARDSYGGSDKADLYFGQVSRNMYTYHRVNSSNFYEQNMYNPSGSIYHTTVKRTGSSAEELYLNGNVVSSGGGPSSTSIPNQQFYICATSDALGASDYYTHSYIQFAYAGNSSPSASTLNTLLLNYFNAV